MSQRPKFAEAFATALASAAKARGWRAYVPVWLLVCLIGGAVAAFFVPNTFWADDKWDVSATFYGGLLAFNGLLLAIGWGAFAKIYEIIGTGEFAAFLRRNKLLDLHLLFVDLAQLSLIGAAFTAGLGMVLVLCPMALWVDRVVMTASIGSSGYAIIKSIAATHAMHDLIWDAAHNRPSAPSLTSVSSER